MRRRRRQHPSEHYVLVAAFSSAITREAAISHARFFPTLTSLYDAELPTRAELIFAFEQAELQMASHKSVSVVVAANWRSSHNALRCARGSRWPKMSIRPRGSKRSNLNRKNALLNAALCSAAMAIDADCQLHSKK